MDTAAPASAILFDLDGVLVDSMPIVRAYWGDWARRHHRDPGEVLAFIHLTAEELVRKFAPDLDAAEEARKTADGVAADFAAVPAEALAW